ncbi:respiratory nitrate reductase subunit gamma [bacterium]|nr:respiratory nitrate reductase subunit gamma [FCB group bacterium]MBL7190360.1 respiratory nitrate reductase subunit gamma [bacterium]
MSDALHFAEHTLQEIALIFMAVVYIIRLLWIFHFKAGRDRQAPTGAFNTTPAKGALYSLANIMMPWGMESTRKKPLFYIQFVIFHLGVVSAILLSFIIPYGPSLLESQFIAAILHSSIGLACLVGCIRMIRRITKPVMRAISSPDDYFSLALLTAWFFFAFWAVPNNTQNGETILLIYFWMTAFFLIYVPFSKISHYLYYPITRYYLGKTLGHRGVYPFKRSNRPEVVNH